VKFSNVKLHEDPFGGFRVTCVKADGAILMGLIRNVYVPKN